MAAERTVLLTGFEPFLGRAVNPSWEAVRLLPYRIAADNGAEAQVVKVLLPVTYGGAFERLRGTMCAVKPDIVIATGLAAGRSELTPEVIAVNLQHTEAPDNAGACPSMARIVPEGPDGLFATLPVNELVQALRQHGFPAKLSYSAGTYVCNDLFYRLMLFARQPGPGEAAPKAAGFIHVPDIAPARIAEALALCVQTCLEPAQTDHPPRA